MERNSTIMPLHHSVLSFKHTVVVLSFTFNINILNNEHRSRKQHNKWDIWLCTFIALMFRAACCGSRLNSGPIWTQISEDTRAHLFVCLPVWCWIDKWCLDIIILLWILTARKPNNIIKRQSCGSFRNVLTCGCLLSFLISSDAMHVWGMKFSIYQQ